MLIRRVNPTPVRRAFTLIEVLIVLSLLIGVSAIVLPRVLARGLDDLRGDTELRLSSGLLDAQREARRIGLTVEIVLMNSAESETSQLVIRPLQGSPVSTPRAGDEQGWGDPESWMGAEPEEMHDASSRTSNVQDPSDHVHLAYVLPDGTVVPASEKIVLTLDAQPMTLRIDTALVRATLTVEDGEGEGLTEYPEESPEGWVP